MKQLIIRTAVLILLAYLGMFIISNAQTGFSAISRDLAISQVNGGNEAFLNMHVITRIANAAPFALTLAYVIFAIAWLWSPASAVLTKLTVGDEKSYAWIPVAAILMFGVTGCQPYDKPEYVEIGNNETAFVFPLEGNTQEQAKLESVDFLKQRKVSSKRIQIQHRWNSTGRSYWNGDHIPLTRVVVVDRSPVTREFNAEDKRLNNAIWVESRDSVGFSLGFNCTAYVTEEDAATFLYWYPSRASEVRSKFVTSLTPVMDSEIRARIQQVAAEVAARYPLDELREKKQEISDAVRSDVVDFFAKRGITITTIGMFGGMTYENPKIQGAIDEVFVAQQQKNVALAEFEAQGKKNETITLAAEAKKTALVTEKKGEAEGIIAVNDALLKANQNPMFLQLRALDVQAKQVEKWNGQFPTSYMGAGGPAALLNIPLPK